MQGFVQKYGIGCFVETGTFLGEGTRFAAGIFPRVVTIEIKLEFQQQAIARLQGFSNIEFLLGELQAISASPHPHVVLIDDARAFLASSPAGMRGPFGRPRPLAIR